MKRVITVWILACVLSGCVTGGAVLTDLDYSFRLLITAIQHEFPGTASVQSANSREWLSSYFLFENGKISKKPVDHAPVREIAQGWILGDRRPYKVVVKVWVEERREDSSSSNPRYRRVGLDKEAAEKLATQIDDYLAKSRENRDLIDDFRAF